MSTYVSGLSDKQWKLLPLKLRQRWWRETDYGKRAPSDALLQAIKQEVLHHVTPDEEAKPS